MVESVDERLRRGVEKEPRFAAEEVRSVLLGLLLAAVAILVGAFAGLWVDPSPARLPAPAATSR